MYLPPGYDEEPERRYSTIYLIQGLTYEVVFAASSAVGLLGGFALFGAFVFIPVDLQAVEDLSATALAWVLLPMLVGFAVAMGLSGRAVAKTGRYRVWPIAGSALAALGMGLAVTLTADTSLGRTLLAVTMVGIGVSTSAQTLLLAVHNAAPAEDLGIASAAHRFFRQLGGTIGVAVFGVLFADRVRDVLRASAISATLDVQGLVGAPATIRALGWAEAASVVRALEQDVSTVFALALGVLVLGFVFALLLPEQHLRSTEDVGRRPSALA